MLGHKLREIRKKSGFTLHQLGEKVGVSHAHLSQVESGSRRASMDLIDKIARFFAIPVSHFFDADQPESSPAIPGMVRVPVFDANCAAGTFRDNPTDCIVDHILMPESVCPRWMDVGAVKLGPEDDSMSPTLNPGDHVCFTRVQEIKDGDIVIVIIDDEGLACKRIKENDEHTVFLVSDNIKYPPRLVKRSEIHFMYRVRARYNTF